MNKKKKKHRPRIFVRKTRPFFIFSNRVPFVPPCLIFSIPRTLPNAAGSHGREARARGLARCSCSILVQGCFCCCLG